MEKTGSKYQESLSRTSNVADGSSKKMTEKRSPHLATQRLLVKLLVTSLSANSVRFDLLHEEKARYA